MRIAIGLAAIAAFWASPAMAADWWLVATTASKSAAAFVDRDSISGSGNLRRAIVLQVLAKDNEQGAAGLQALMEFDCPTMRYRFISLTAYTLSGSKIDDQTGSGTWRPVDKGAVNEAQLQFVCTSGAQPGDTVSFGSAMPIERGRARLGTEKPGTYGGH